jgi:hypothetical protein
MASGADCGKPKSARRVAQSCAILYSGAALRRRAPSDQFVDAFCLQRIGITRPSPGAEKPRPARWRDQPAGDLAGVGTPVDATDRIAPTWCRGRLCRPDSASRFPERVARRKLGCNEWWARQQRLQAVDYCEYWSNSRRGRSTSDRTDVPHRVTIALAHCIGSDHPGEDRAWRARLADAAPAAARFSHPPAADRADSARRCRRTAPRSRACVRRARPSLRARPCRARPSRASCRE